MFARGRLCVTFKQSVQLVSIQFQPDLGRHSGPFQSSSSSSSLCWNQTKPALVRWWCVNPVWTRSRSWLRLTTAPFHHHHHMSDKQTKTKCWWLVWLLPIRFKVDISTYNQWSRQKHCIVWPKISKFEHSSFEFFPNRLLVTVEKLSTQTQQCLPILSFK